MERLTSWLKNKNVYNDYYFEFKLYDKQYLKKGLWLYGIECSYKTEDGEIDTDIKYFLVSDHKTINDLLNRKRGFDCNASANNGVRLHNYYIDGYLFKDYDTFNSLRH